MSDLEEVVALMAKLKESEKVLTRSLATLQTEAHNVASAGKVIKSSQKVRSPIIRDTRLLTISQIETLRASLTEKRAKYIAAIDALEKDLHSKVEAALKDRLRQQVYKNIKESLQAQIDQKVREKVRILPSAFSICRSLTASSWPIFPPLFASRRPRTRSGWPKSTCTYIMRTSIKFYPKSLR